PIPPSSPTTCTPGRLDSKNSSSEGRSTPRSAVPKTSLIAPTRHPTAPLPWPMQGSPCTSRAAPFTTPRMSPSGHAFRQERLPRRGRSPHRRRQLLRGGRLARDVVLRPLPRLQRAGVGAGRPGRVLHRLPRRRGHHSRALRRQRLFVVERLVRLVRSRPE